MLLISRKRVDARLIAKYPDRHFERVPGLPFSWRPFRLAACLVSQARAVAFCLRLIARTKPDVAIGFGGFTSAPLVLASGDVVHAGAPTRSTGAFQQATRCSVPSWRSGGGSAWQRRSAKGQRGEKRQPLG